MTIKDIGPEPHSFDLEEATLENTDYRAVAWSGKYLQLTLMSIPVGEDIGLEAHPETDQFLRLDAGRGRVQMGSTKDRLDYDREVEDGWAIFVPAGTWHNVTNIGSPDRRGPTATPRGPAPTAPAEAASRTRQPQPSPPGRGFGCLGRLGCLGGAAVVRSMAAARPHRVGGTLHGSQARALCWKSTPATAGAHLR
ncbi:cupin domain-containing protein [Streptomyces sp. NPDC029216]|uniref:cupin domain-containing protein n=1 Tax=Streptomyces sp. NPDC029216 TaxID=3154701 RepID=UPI0033D3865F